MSNNESVKDITVHEATTVMPQAQIAGITSPQKVVELSTEVRKYIKSQNLEVNIQGNDYVMVEGWQFAGILLGLMAQIVEVKNECSYQPITFNWKTKKYGKLIDRSYKTKEYKYQAVCEFVDQNQVVRSRGFAVCSNEEAGKHDFSENAIMSMAQTRSIGKAGRASLSWLIKSAGYVPTPAEEMLDKTKVEDQIDVEAEPLPVDIEYQILTFTEADRLSEWANQMTEYHGNVMFLNMVKHQIKLLRNGK